MKSESLFADCKKCGKSVHETAARCPECGHKQKKTNIPVVVGIAVISLYMIGAMTNDDKKAPANELSETPSDLALDYTSDKSGFGSIMKADITIQNRGHIEVKDIVIRCDHFAKSGTEIDHNERTIYDIVPANSSRTFPAFNMGFMHQQAESTSCKIKSFTAVK